MKKKVLCRSCDGEVEKVAKALCQKLFDEKTTRIYCLKCLAEYFEISTDDLLEKAREFKAEGCPLFK